MSYLAKYNQAIFSIRCFRVHGIAMPKIHCQLLTEPVKRINVNFVTCLIYNRALNVIDIALRTLKVTFSTQPKYKKSTGHHSNPIAVPNYPQFSPIHF